MSPQCDSDEMGKAFLFGVSTAQFTHPDPSYPPGVNYSLYDRLSDVLWDFEGKRYCGQPKVPFVFVLCLFV